MTDSPETARPAAPAETAAAAITSALTTPPAKPKPAPKKKARMVWVVLRRKGLTRVASDRVAGLIAKDKGRRATPRDLSIAGVTGATETED